MQEGASMGLLLLSNRADGFCSNLSKLLGFWPGKALQVRKAFLLLLTVPFGGLAPSLSSHKGNSRCLLSSSLYLLQKVSQQNRQSYIMLYWEWGASLCFQQAGQPKGNRKTGYVPPALTAWRQEVPHLLPCCFVPLLSRIPAAPLTLILALESAAMLAFPSVAETRQTEGKLPGAVKALPVVFGNSFALQGGDPGD